MKIVDFIVLRVYKSALDTGRLCYWQAACLLVHKASVIGSKAKKPNVNSLGTELFPILQQEVVNIYGDLNDLS